MPYTATPARRSHFRQTLLASALMLALSATAHAGEGTHSYNLPVQSLAQALEQLHKESGLDFVYSPNDLANLKSPALNGQFTAQEALRLLLSGSGLQAEFVNERVVAIKPAPVPPSVKETEMTPIEVKARRDEDAEAARTAYRRPNASTATKTDTPLMQTPMSVEVVPQQILKDLGMTSSSSLADVLTYLGVQTLGIKDSGDFLFFRGFLSTATLWNGFRIEDVTPSINYANGGVWMANVDRLEVLKGPSSILYGRTEPGGAVNVLTKQPQQDFHGEVNAGAGSQSDRWLGADLTGALNADKTLLYRLNIAREDSGSWFSYGPKSKSEGIAPVLEWKISPQTALTFEGQYRRYEGGDNVQQGIPIDPATGQPVPVEPKDTMMPGNISQFRQNRILLALNHEFNPDWSVSLKYMHNDANNPYYRNSYAACGPSGFPLGPGQTPLCVYDGKSRQKTDATMLDLTGHVTTLGIQHTLLLGMDYYRKQFNLAAGNDFGSQTTDYLNPTLPASVPFTDTWSVSNREYAAYVQDQMALSNNWHLLLGGRYQTINEHARSNFPSFGSPPDDSVYKNSLFQPRLGLLWQPRPWLSTYYSYAENIGSSNGLDFTGKSIEPELSKQHELGVKSTWLEGRLTLNLALFDLTKYNIAAADPIHAGFNIGLGEVKSTGYELNIQGALTDAWNVLANYSHARPRVVAGASGAAALQPQSIVAGQDLPGVANDTFAVWTSYKLPDNWKVGGGVNWASAQNSYDGATLKTKSYTVASAFAAYETRLSGHTTTLQLNVDNVFNERYLLGQSDDVAFGGGSLIGSWGAPRQIRLSLRVAL
ncbi:MAG: TonB-dependent siderophore receptor [Thiobacillaceae bacterium]